jgi:hypothetical protein
MSPQRARQADALLGKAGDLVAEGALQEAHQVFTDFHDLVLDDPERHLAAHVALLPLNRALGHRQEAATDRILIALAPLGVFSLITHYFHARARLSGSPLYAA